MLHDQTQQPIGTKAAHSVERPTTQSKYTQQGMHHDHTHEGQDGKDDFEDLSHEIYADGIVWEFSLRIFGHVNQNGLQSCTPGSGPSLELTEMRCTYKEAIQRHKRDSKRAQAVSVHLFWHVN